MQSRHSQLSLKFPLFGLRDYLTDLPEVADLLFFSVLGQKRRLGCGPLTGLRKHHYGHLAFSRGARGQMKGSVGVSGHVGPSGSQISLGKVWKEDMDIVGRSILGSQVDWSTSTRYCQKVILYSNLAFQENGSKWLIGQF